MSAFTVDENGFVIDSRGRVVSGHADQNTARSFATMSPAEKVAAGLDAARRMGVPPSPANVSAVMERQRQATGASPDAGSASVEQNFGVEPAPMTARPSPTGAVPFEQGVEPPVQGAPADVSPIDWSDYAEPAILAMLGIRPLVSMTTQGAVPVTTGASGAGAVIPRAPDVTRAEFAGVRMQPAVGGEQRTRVTGPDEPPAQAAPQGRVRAAPHPQTSTTDPLTGELVPGRQDSHGNVTPFRRQPTPNVNTAATPDVVYPPVDPAVRENFGIGYVQTPEGNVRTLMVNGEDGVSYRFAPSNGTLYDDMGRPVRAATEREMSTFLSDPTILRAFRAAR